MSNEMGHDGLQAAKDRWVAAGGKLKWATMDALGIGDRVANTMMSDAIPEIKGKTLEVTRIHEEQFDNFTNYTVDEEVLDSSVLCRANLPGEKNVWFLAFPKETPIALKDEVGTWLASFEEREDPPYAK